MCYNTMQDEQVVETALNKMLQYYAKTISNVAEENWCTDMCSTITDAVDVISTINNCLYNMYWDENTVYTAQQAFTYVKSELRLLDTIVWEQAWELLEEMLEQLN